MSKWRQKATWQEFGRRNHTGGGGGQAAPARGAPAAIASTDGAGSDGQGAEAGGGRAVDLKRAGGRDDIEERSCSAKRPVHEVDAETRMIIRQHDSLTNAATALGVGKGTMFNLIQSQRPKDGCLYQYVDGGGAKRAADEPSSFMSGVGKAGAWAVLDGEEEEDERGGWKSKKQRVGNSGRESIRSLADTRGAGGTDGTKCNKDAIRERQMTGKEQDDCTAVQLPNKFFQKRFSFFLGSEPVFKWAPTWPSAGDVGKDVVPARGATAAIASTDGAGSDGQGAEAGGGRGEMREAGVANPASATDGMASQNTYTRQPGVSAAASASAAAASASAPPPEDGSASLQHVKHAWPMRHILWLCSKIAASGLKWRAAGETKPSWVWNYSMLNWLRLWQMRPGSRRTSGTLLTSAKFAWATSSGRSPCT